MAQPKRADDPVTEAGRPRTGEKGRQTLGHRHGPGPRAPAAVGGGEGLVQVQVDDVEAHVAGPHHTQDGVEIGTVVVEETTDLVDGIGDGHDVLLEEPQGVRVGEHDPGHVLVEHRAQRLEVDTTALVARDRDDLVAAQCHRGRIGAVGGVGDDHLVPGVPCGRVPGSHEQEAGQLAGRARRGLQAWRPPSP